MIQVDVPIAFGVGTLLAGAARRQIQSRARGETGRALAAVVIFHALTYMWPPLYLLVFYFGFETSHMWFQEDSVQAYPWLLPAFYLAMFVAVLAGFSLGAQLVRAGRAELTWLVFGATTVFTLAWIGLQPDRTLTLGTYREWAAGTAPPASSDPAFMRFVLAVIVFYSAALWLMYGWLRRDGRRFQA